MRTCNYRLYLSLTDSVSGLQEIGTLEAYKVVENIRKAMFDQGVMFEEIRINRSNPRQIFVEKLLRIELFNTDMSKIERLVDILKLAFNQKSIMVEEIESAQEII